MVVHVQQENIRFHFAGRGLSRVTPECDRLQLDQSCEPNRSQYRDDEMVVSD